MKPFVVLKMCGSRGALVSPRTASLISGEGEAQSFFIVQNGRTAAVDVGSLERSLEWVVVIVIVIAIV
jgi:hypothetical protein